MALRKVTDRFETIVVSQNVTNIMHLSLDELFECQCFSRLIHQDARDGFRSRLQDIGVEALDLGNTNFIDPDIFSV